MLFLAIDFKTACLQGPLGGINIDYLSVLFDYIIFFFQRLSLVSFNCQLDTAWSHLRRKGVSIEKLPTAD